MPARRRSAEPEVQLVKISDLARLSGVPGPTIKHYMREGLLPEPHQRTSRNMAYYDARLADRVKVIKELQQERFLPLKLIADLLEPCLAPRRRWRCLACRSRGRSARPGSGTATVNTCSIQPAAS